MRPAAIAFATTGFLASIAAAALVATFAVATLEDTTKRNSISALVASGQSWAQIETEGTLVLLTGTAPDERRRIQAFDAISGVVSTTRIRNLMEVEESIPVIAPQFALEILRSGDDVSLIGITPSEREVDIIHEALAKIDGVSLIDMKEYTAWDAPEGW
ncbi:MAG: BON domain-containing protein, partial [Halocynthiibacter sp.]